MASDIIPIELGLTAGDGITLWASRWEEDGEEWEAFLGHGDQLYVLPDAAHLAALIRSDIAHDLRDHPQWALARRALADELIPDDDHRFDIVGIPELVAGQPDVWTLAELADTVAILHSLAEVCDLPVIEEVIAAAPGFAAAAQGPAAFVGRLGKRLWNQVGSVVAEQWDKIIEALDAIVTTPELPEEAVAAAQREIDAVGAAEAAFTEPEAEELAAQSDEERDPDLVFWDEVGIDCLRLTCDGRTGFTLRCYLDEAAVFLAQNGRIQLYPSAAALEEYLADPTAENSLSGLDAWTTIREAITGGEASVLAGPENTYVLDGLGAQLADGPAAVDANQLGLAVELLTDAGASRGDEEAAAALSTATPLGNLIRAVVTPDPDRLPPSPPFDGEVAAWDTLVAAFAANIDWN